MRLIHLGAFYSPSGPMIETVETDTELCFRGRPCKMRAPKTMPAQPAVRSLIYRGVRYSG
ncbi:DUF4278 domain-containing protein [Leptothoe sp. PORK10 BA2]|uniref:DUF4278 domain-containing protein n=1 Tax=Leptothoe sp. PORK10 BA2 TaxID=3110254 RepID=UPI002B20FF43|nr:DUF4278 domain-containing protein [Leptothoe sp. PORK10 BA2]MEA5464139.1 DUF4278 domain-containing protein [Leptothoe sp. PORK10 BA2]